MALSPLFTRADMINPRAMDAVMVSQTVTNISGKLFFKRIPFSGIPTAMPNTATIIAACRTPTTVCTTNFDRV